MVNAEVRLALPSPPIGTVVKQTDNDQEYLLLATPSNVDANWLEFTGANYPVTSVFGRTGDISLLSGVDVNTIGGASIVGNGDITSLTVDIIGNVVATGNVEAAFFLGNGTFMSGVATLNSSGLIQQHNLNGYLTVPQGYVANAAVRLSLGSNALPIGSLVRQTDNGNSYLLTETPSNVDANWLEFTGLNFPVNTVFGRVGDIVSSYGDYTDGFIELEANIGPILAGNSVSAALTYLNDNIVSGLPASGNIDTGNVSANTSLVMVRS